MIIELKNDEFKHEDLGQLNAYVGYYKKNEMTEGDNLPVGILLCTDKGSQMVEYALSGMDNQLFVSTYMLHLPDKKKLKKWGCSFMIVKQIYSPDVYRKIMNAAKDKKDDIYRYELMLPFQGKWDCYHIPLKAAKEGGYDIIMANNRMGLLSPSKVDLTTKDWIEAISDRNLWDACQKSIENALARFINKGIELKVQEYLFSIFLADPENAYTKMNEGYCGDGGIPGFVMGWLVPNERNLKKLPAALAHETNHNVRYQFIKWTNDITLGEMLVGEGLAENYAVAIHGEKFLGPWVSKTDPELLPLIKEIIYDGLNATGFENITAYLYGDEMARMQCFPEVGLPYCAGYAVGYYLVRYYLQKTGISIEEATILPHGEILKEVEEFWSKESFDEMV